MSSFRVGSERFAVQPALGAGRASGRFRVAAGGAGYEVTMAPPDPGPAAAVAALLGVLDAPLVVADAAVLDLHVPGGFEGVPCLGLEAAEATKTLEGAGGVLDFLVEHRAGRTSTVVAIGGGVVQDVTGFACGIYKRGLAWRYVPTTLLAQADSCIGSKTGVNYRATKNLLGLFHAPTAVLSHPGFLSTLAEDDLRSGLGEIFKLCVTGGPSCLGRFEAALEDALHGDGPTIHELAALALAVKRPVIEADERDLGARRALNFGHSVGHAIEALTDYAVPHGIAVTLGALVECAVSRSRGHLHGATFARLVATATVLVPGHHARRLGEIDPGALLRVLGRDKKVEGAVLKLPVPVELGAIELLDLRLDASGLAELEGALAQVRSLL